MFPAAGPTAPDQVQDVGGKLRQLYAGSEDGDADRHDTGEPHRELEGLGVEIRWSQSSFLVE
jgi:hypothetical protein